MKDDEFSQLLSIWRPENPPRVWSFIVTLFGDLAQESGAYLTGAAISATLDGIGIKSDAIRVALHRLRKDGWIESKKSGRNSKHSLTNWGLMQCSAANPVIYGPWPDTKDAWLIVTDSGSQSTIKTEHIHQVGSNLFVSRRPVDVRSAFAIPLGENQDIPDWISNRLCPPDLQAASKDLRDKLLAFQSVQADFASLTLTQATVLRTLIVHEWRRTILKAPGLPEFLFPTDWRGAECRRLVSQVLSQLPPVELNKINALISSHSVNRGREFDVSA